MSPSVLVYLPIKVSSKRSVDPCRTTSATVSSVEKQPTAKDRYRCRYSILNAMQPGENNVQAGSLSQVQASQYQLDQSTLSPKKVRPGGYISVWASNSLSQTLSIGRLSPFSNLRSIRFTAGTRQRGLMNEIWNGHLATCSTHRMTR